MTVLFQDFVRYQLTVEENIGLGRADVPLDRERSRRPPAGPGQTASSRTCRAACRRGSAGSSKAAPRYSGGQWQRLALARAFYRGGDFLILDEPTAALDPRAEHRLYEQVRELAEGRTVLLISHRFSSVRMADRIYVLKDGRVIEQGSHQELVELDGLYAELYRLQARTYSRIRRPTPARARGVACSLRRAGSDVVMLHPGMRRRTRRRPERR